MVAGLLVFLPLSLAQADGTEGLGIPVGVSIASGTGMVTAGTGLAVQPADINVAVPAAASVQQVLLYWEGLHHESGPGDNTVEVNGNPVTGDLIGGPTLFFSQTASSSFRADITTLAAVVPGNNVLSISGLVNSGDFATSDGASVVVIFDDGSAPANLQIRDGNDVAFANFSPPIDTTVAQTFNFPASVQDRTADLTLMVGNVEQDRPNSIKITVGGTTTTLADQLASNQGSDWDNLLLPVLVPAGETSLTVQVLSAPDGSGRLPASLIWVAATLSLSAPVDNVDLSVTKTDSPDPVQVGDELTYTVTVTNNSATDATGVVAEDTLPAGVTFVSAVSTIGSCAEAAGTVTCDIGNLGAGQSAVITIKVTPTAAGEIENTVTVTGTEPDPDPTNNTATTTTTVNPIPMVDLSVTKTDSPDPVQVGDELTYTVTVTNNSPTTGATGVVAEDTLPAGVTFVSAVSTIGSCAEAAGTVTCDIGNLGAGQSAVITIKVTPTAAGQIENTVSVTGDQPDPDPTNNTATTTTTVNPIPMADLSVTKTDSPDPVQVGDELTYTVTVTNNSPTTGATGVVAEDTLPAGVTFVSAVSTIGSCAEAAGTVTCDIGNLGAGQSAVITIKVTPTAAGEIENTVTVTGTEPDPDPTNNTATTTTTVNPIPMVDLSVTKTDSPDPVQVGDELTYTVTVTNNSPTTGATGVVAEDTLPAGVTFVSAVSTIGSCAEAAGTVTCDIGNLGAGQSAVITIKVTPTAAGQIENTVSVTGTEPDPDPTNNTATTTTTVNPACPVPTTPEITHGSAFGLDASVLGLNIVKAGLVSTVAPGSPAAAARRSITINVPLVLAATINENQSASSLTPAPNSKASSTISNVSLLSGLVTATSIRGVSQSVASQTSASYNSTGSEIQGLKVNNVPVSVSPNQKVLVKDPLIPTRVIAELHIYQESGTSTFAGSLSQASHSVNMLRLVLLKSFLGLPTGAEIIVAHAQSDAQGPAVNCPDAQSVSGEAFTALVQGKFNGNVIAETKIGEALLPPTGGSDSDGTTASIPGVVTNSTTTNTTSGSLSPNPNATARSVIQGLNLFAGLVTATAVDVSSTSSANGLTAGTQFAATFVNLKVGSTTVSANVAPNSVISLSLPGGGFLVVIINERTVGGNGTTDTEGTINAIHAFAFTPGGLLESEVIVASAHSDAHS